MATNLLTAQSRGLLAKGNPNRNNMLFGTFQPERQNNPELYFVPARFQLNEYHRCLKISELCSLDHLAYPQLIVASPLLHNLITKPMLKDRKGDAKEPT
jgi:hypothetical protein